MNIRYVLAAVIFLLLTFRSYSQHDHKDELHDHEHPKNEIGFSNNAVFNVTENEFAYSLHLHIVKTIGNSDKIGLGLGYERIFDDHKHNALGIIFMLRPIESLSFNLSPGISWLQTKSNSLKPVMHIEGLYEWQFNHFHVGPLLGMAFNPDDFHVSVGLHLAFGF